MQLMLYGNGIGMTTTTPFRPIRRGSKPLPLFLLALNYILYLLLLLLFLKWMFKY